MFLVIVVKHFKRKIIQPIFKKSIKHRNVTLLTLTKWKFKDNFPSRHFHFRVKMSSIEPKSARGVCVGLVPALEIMWMVQGVSFSYRSYWGVKDEVLYGWGQVSSFSRSFLGGEYSRDASELFTHENRKTISNIYKRRFLFHWAARLS